MFMFIGRQLMKDSCWLLKPSGSTVAPLSLSQEVAGSNPFTVMTNISITEFTEFNENI